MLEEHKVGRWKELFESFEKAFSLLTSEVEKETMSISMLPISFTFMRCVWSMHEKRCMAI